ncbi:MAG: YfjI family protein [Candidatus Sumerlaeota bacterium]|nr:YfjI family protein [Candidatus Sumerlaeota bacterium]
MGLEGLPNGWDVNDEFKARGREGLLSLYESARQWRPNSAASTTSDEPPKPVEVADSQAGEAEGERRGEWSPPIALWDFDPPAFPVHVLPDRFRRFVEAVSVATQTPLDLAGMLVLSAVAVCLAKKVEIMAREGWLEPLNLFVVVVLPPAARKSAVFRVVVAPIEAHERRLAEGVAPQIREAKVRLKILEGRKQRLEKQTIAKPDPLHQKELVELTREIEETCIPASPRLIVDDVTPEKLASLLSVHGGRMAVLSPEGDIFDIITGRYSAKGDANFGVLLKGHCGDTLRVDRVTRPSEHIPKPALTLGLAIQPEVILGVMNQGVLRGRGLLARFLYSLPRSLIGQRSVDPPPVPNETQDQYSRYMMALLQIEPAIRQDGEPEPHVLRLSDQADSALRAFQVWLEPRLAEGAELGTIADWAGKLAGAVVRIAGLLHMADWIDTPAPWEKPIPESTMTRAISLGQYLIAHAKAAFGLMGADPAIASARTLLRWIHYQQKPKFTKRAAFQGLRGSFKRANDLDAPLQILVEHNIIRPVDLEQPRGPGRPPSPGFEVNPQAMEPTDSTVIDAPAFGNSEYFVNSEYRDAPTNIDMPGCKNPKSESPEGDWEEGVL